MEQKPMKLNIQLDEKESEGIYSNLALIVFSPSEMIFDFARVMPGVNKGKIFSRIVMTPQNAKSFLKSLEDNIKKYESQFGEIKVFGKPDDKNIGFHTIKPTKEGE
ncbi:MAG: DUF3467 domain-containing protein [candidate division Zixibacteria bacterium]|nr:DUF3467 domain-containing protein [candidate division Zixibacteria bacterium]